MRRTKPIVESVLSLRLVLSKPLTMTTFYSTLKRVSNDFLFHKLRFCMNNDLYHKRNERKVSFCTLSMGARTSFDPSTV